MKYLNVFDDTSALTSAMTSINHGDGAYIFGVKTNQGIEDVTIYDLRHPGGNCPAVYNAYPVNMSPVKLDSSSTKKTPAVADILYSTADGKLTLDSQTEGVDNTAIAICVIPEVVMENFSEGDESTGAVKTARFVSLNYMNYRTPTTGSISVLRMRFGNYEVTVGNVKGDTIESSFVGGKWNTQKCLHACYYENSDLTNGVTDNEGTGFCAPACCCVAYSTPGTKPGDWYLPAIGELHEIYVNKTAINEKRTTLVDSGFSDSYGYWSSREDSSADECWVSLKDGFMFSDRKNNGYYVLGFLALEV